ncbi:MAG TPA: energy transducer TonB, partial [Arachidicoccus sp.]
ISNSLILLDGYLHLVLPLLGCVTFVFAFRAHRIEEKKNEALVDEMILGLKVQNTLNSVNNLRQGLSQNDATNLKLVTVSAETKKGQGVISIKKNTTYLNDESINTPAYVQGRLIQGLKPLYVLNGKRINEDVFMTLSPDEIESIEVLKGMSAMSSYGVQAKDGVLLITTKNDKAVELKKVSFINKSGKDVIYSFSNEGKMVHGMLVDVPAASLRPGLNAAPVLMLNDKKMPQDDMEKTDVSSILSGSVTQGGIDNYRHDNHNGIIGISAKGIPHVQTGMLMFVDSAGKTANVFIPDQVEPSFPGGPGAWVQYLQQNLHERVPADNHAPAGQYSIVVSFLINKQGNVSDVKAIAAPAKDYGTAAEAVRIIKESGGWNPAIQNGRVVTYRQKQRITFTVQD